MPELRIYGYLSTWLLGGLLIILAACAPIEPPAPPERLIAGSATALAVDTTASKTSATDRKALADVVDVSVSGQAGAYQFAVTISSPDSGCDRYADWWEVISASGDLLYRRILTHSHVTEQPFTRSGGPVELLPEETVYVRAHMHPDGYGGATFVGTVTDGFAAAAGPIELPAGLAIQDPQPGVCAF